ncbi:Beta-galactosidase-1-like protein 2 [Geodia barretti]|uniref:Beta-galactosidase-1-like protein 2 n=3 Tax=Geodia barretti TaxID=519541 RepID=A0AA35QVV8_GEOBA|nr:Beta-galactosidase-1-like protein 2 [Geodia barretti]
MLRISYTLVVFSFLSHTRIPLSFSLPASSSFLPLPLSYSPTPTHTPNIHTSLLFLPPPSPSLSQLMRDLGARELMFTSDGQYRISESLRMKPHRDVVHTLNYQNAHDNPLQRLKREAPHHPLMVMEFWTGWFDHWGEKHLERNISPEDFSLELRAILAEGASVNLYMFHGGTNFGFMNGGNWGEGEERGRTYRSTVSSYDYDAPLSEWGSVTKKYLELRNLLVETVPESLSLNPLPPLPLSVPTADYGEIKMTLYISLLSTLQYVPEPHTSGTPIPMEFLPLNKWSGQGFGYILYRTFVPSSASSLTIHGLKDYGLVMLDLKPIREVGYFDKVTISLPSPSSQGLPSRQLDILVENGGRVNFGHPLAVRKGISGSVVVDGVTQANWKIYSFEFKNSFIQNIDRGGVWLRTPAKEDSGPALFKGSFTIDGTPKDTFIDMQGWNKGVVFVNGANLGRYWMKGPPGSLYVPAPLLSQGINKVMVFEFSNPKSPPQTVSFRSTPVLDISHRHR